MFCSLQLHHLNHIFALLPVPSVSPSRHLSPPPPLFSCPVLAARRRDIPAVFRNDSGDSSVLNSLRERRSGTDWGGGRPLSDGGESDTGDHVSRRHRLSSVSFFRSLPRPRSPSAIAHALFNPYPNSLGPNADLFFHRDSKHTSVFLSDAQTND